MRPNDCASPSALTGPEGPNPEPPSLARIEAEFEAVMGRAERVGALCDELREDLSRRPPPERLCLLSRLAPLLRKRAGAIALPVFTLLEQAAGSSSEPWPLLEGMLLARDAALQERALALSLRLVHSGALTVDRRARCFLAERVGAEGSHLQRPDMLRQVAALLRPATAPPDDSVLALLLDESDPSLRHLAARILDLEGRPPSPETAARILGAGPYAFLREYLEYTRAGHGDLIQVAAGEGAVPLVVESLRRAEATCGQARLKEAMAEIGWPRANLGLEVRAFSAVTRDGSFPLMLSPAEAALIEAPAEGELPAPPSYLFVAHGGPPSGRGEAATAEDPVARFRAYNLIHADALADLVDVAPLTVEKVDRILGRMDRLVEDFTALFSAASDECAILPGVYRDLRKRILSQLDRQTSRPQLSAELTRLVQMFEDPRTLGGVRTLHGLKRYLHQQGLRLGMRLVGSGRVTNRTVDLLPAPRGRVGQPIRRIAFVDFEPEAPGVASESLMPYPVAAMVDAFARQVLAGQSSFPDVRIFCYGTEIHYYVSFGNHPAFLRVNFAPPLQGGMIDLEYYGVSKYEMAAHPNLALDALRLFFRRLEFDVSIENTRVHARYDKERALDLGDICRKAEALFRLAPYLMELDWVLGSLDLDASARSKVADRWAHFFLEWGTIPIDRFLSSNRRAIRVALEIGPEGEREVLWSGEGPYQDAVGVPPPPVVFANLRKNLERLGIPVHPALEEGSSRGLGQMSVERIAIGPLRAAVDRGELVATEGSFSRRPADLFRREHETELLASLLCGDDESLAGAVRTALLIEPLQRTLRFETTGSVNGYDAQRAGLPLLGGGLSLCVLRDGENIIRLALFARGDVLYRQREDRTAAWQSNWSMDASDLAAILRRAGYPAARETPTAGLPAEEASTLRELFLRPNPAESGRPLPGERRLSGLRASPGRAVGPARFLAGNREPCDFAGAIMIAPSLRPEHAAFLYQSSGIVSTGGGILSHAGLIANQFRKPAMIVSGEWSPGHDDAAGLVYRTPEYAEEEHEICGIRICIRRDAREREHRLREGDIMVLDADEGTVRILGQDRDTVAFHEEAQALHAADLRLEQARHDRELLSLRGQRLHAGHQIEKLLRRLADPVLACHAVHEILLGEAFAGVSKTGLMRLLLENPTVTRDVRRYLGHTLARLRRRYHAEREKALQRIPGSPSACEVLALRLRVRHLGRSLGDAAGSLAACGLAASAAGEEPDRALEAAALLRLEQILESLERAAQAAAGADPRHPRLRHLLHALDRIYGVLAGPESAAPTWSSMSAALVHHDEAAASRLGARYVLFPAECGHGLHPLIGWKAANLAELARMGTGTSVPDWFAVTHRAFEEMLGTPADTAALGIRTDRAVGLTLREAIGTVLARSDIGRAQQSAYIRSLWEAAPLPDAIARDVRTAYEGLCPPNAPDAESLAGRPGRFVAIRSSSREEDAEVAARAGEFDTFLFIEGGDRVIASLKRAWSGLWTERAIHNRALLGIGEEHIGGGIVIQRMVESRVSGVLQTVNAAEHEMREIVINAGLGLGEGVVSGTVAADQIIILKGGDPDRVPLRFRYATADKRERIVFDRKTGAGTAREETLYHQRLRPALEYVELCELVRVATGLEAAFGYPLDIEFGIEAARLYILQARPVPAFLAAFQETVERDPLVPQ